MRDDDHRLRQRHNRQDGNVQQNILESYRRSERRGAQGDHNHQDQNENADPRLTEADKSPQQARKDRAGM